VGAVQWWTFYEIFGGEGLVGMPPGKFLTFRPRKWHLQNSENIFCKKNNVLINGIII
jgi:hypothetical protein